MAKAKCTRLRSWAVPQPSRNPVPSLETYTLVVVLVLSWVMSVVKTPAMSSGRLFPNVNTCMFVGRSAGRGCDRLLYMSMAIKFMDAPVSTSACVGEPLTMTLHLREGWGTFPVIVGRPRLSSVCSGAPVTLALISAFLCWCGGSSLVPAAFALGQRVLLGAGRTRAEERVIPLGGGRTGRYLLVAVRRPLLAPGRWGGERARTEERVFPLGKGGRYLMAAARRPCFF
ncbi:hypothetical protein NDU88_002943 [Pleurodeles waltl]|uniref:Uncharacterized protein n=1 Tax=Pleurodeles waltl TaxID=8319 RepID=A0AAV7SEV4_PLEWA|nr:hypothetical protein NDU88_002943 [Pleurodeles waltl]